MISRLIRSIPAAVHRYRVSRVPFAHRGSNLQLSPGFEIVHAGSISIGDDVYIGPGAWINGMGGLTVGSGSIFGPRVTIYTANHNFREAQAIPYDDVILPAKVDIGENVWVGGNVIFVPGAGVGEGCIVGSGSVVTKRFPPFSIIGGNPAKVIGQRDEEHYLALKREGKIYLKLKSEGIMKPHLRGAEESRA